MENVVQLKQFILSLKVRDPRVDSVFQEILIEGMNLLGLVDDDCARLFDVSRPTVNRWRNGSTAPHRAMRIPLCNVLKKEASKRIKAYERMSSIRKKSYRKARKPNIRQPLVKAVA